MEHATGRNLMQYIPLCLWIIQNKSYTVHRTQLLFFILVVVFDRQ